MRKNFLYAILITMISVLMVACGAQEDYSNYEISKDVAAEECYSEEVFMDKTTAEFDEETGGGYSLNGGDMGTTLPSNTQGNKFVYTGNIDMESTEFDKTIEGFMALVAEKQGYFESSNMEGTNNNRRYASYKVRLPQDKMVEFMSQVGDLCQVLYSSTDVEDISFKYYDTKGRLETKQIKLERLNNLLSQATTMEDIITIETAISDTEYEIDELSGTMRQYDSMVDFATVYVNISEVIELSEIEEVPVGFGERVSAAFGNGFEDFVEFAENLVVGLVYNIFWLIILGIIIVIMVVVIRFIIKRVDSKGKN